MSETAGTYHLRWAVMHDLIPVTVIEPQGPFPPTAYDLYYIDRTRNIIWIPYAEWWMKEEGK